jgi:hypothetical protein
MTFAFLRDRRRSFETAPCGSAIVHAGPEFHVNAKAADGPNELDLSEQIQ